MYERTNGKQLIHTWKDKVYHRSSPQKNKEIVNVRYGQLGTRDDEEKDGVKEHIPDIPLSFVDGKEHSLDICIETKFNEVGLCGYEPTKGLRRRGK